MIVDLASGKARQLLDDHNQSNLKPTELSCRRQTTVDRRKKSPPRIASDHARGGCVARVIMLALRIINRAASAGKNSRE
jgi:hypothetical protein